jgi:glycosyltransferase involved in cell wall biosynthesis
LAPEQPELCGRHVAVVNWRDLAHTQAGGSERYAWEMACALRDAGAHVEFVTGRDAGQRRTEAVDGIDVRRRGGSFTFYLAASAALLRRRRTLDLVVEAENGIPAFAPLVVRRGTPVVLVMHHVHLDQFGTHFPAPVAWVGRLLEGRVMPRAYRNARTVAVSGSTETEMRERLHWTGPVTVIPNGAPPKTIDEAPTADEPGSETPVRLSVLGRLAAHKRVDSVIRAVAELRARGRSVRLDVVGRGPEQAALEALVRELGLTEHVRLHGFVSDEVKDALVGASALHVCASDGEGWGQVVIEAAAWGVPTVARRVPGLRDSIVPGETGWLLEDSLSLADGIDSALRELADPGRREEMARACEAWAARFSWSDSRRAFVELAVQALEAAPARVGPAVSGG